MHLGMVIRGLRLEQGKTLEELAFAAETDASNLSRIERGLQQCSSEGLARIAAALGVSISTLYQRAEAATPDIPERTPPKRIRPPADEELQMRFQALSPENRELALAFIQLLARRQLTGKTGPAAATDAEGNPKNT